jgi:hypothetical protein
VNAEREIEASLGLHRGRRALAIVSLLVCAVALLAMLPEGSRESSPVVAAPTPESLPSPSSPPRPPKKSRVAPRREVASPPVAAARVVVSERVVSAPTPASDVAPVVAERVVSAPAPIPEVTEPKEELVPPPAPAPQPVESPDLLTLDGNGESIARAIASAKRAAVRDCFERELKQAPTLTGTVVVELDLAPPNHLGDVRVTDDLQRPAFTRCVTSTMQQVRFTGLDEEVSINVPYVLSPERRR